MYKSGNRSTKPLAKLRSIPLPLLIGFVALMFVILILVNNGKKPRSQFVSTNKIKGSFEESLVQLEPTVDFMNGTDVIWQIPNSPKAVLYLAHGCNGRASNFWDKSPKCPHCIGLPEERLIVLQALARRFAVVAVSSAGRCWTLGKETLIVQGIIKWWVEKQKLESLPLVALGASSGGYFVSVLANKMRFSSIVLMIAEGVFDDTGITKEYPPTMFVYMPKDVVRKERISEALEIMREKGIDVAEVECMEFPLSPGFLADRIPGLDLKIAMELFNLLQEKGFIEKYGYMRHDGRAIHWKEAMQEKKIHLPDELLVKHIQEEMNLAFAYHEMTSLQSEQIFSWFESHMS